MPKKTKQEQKHNFQASFQGIVGCNPYQRTPIKESLYKPYIAVFFMGYNPPESRENYGYTVRGTPTLAYQFLSI